MVPGPIAGYEPHIIYMACAAEGYVGQVLVEDGQMDVAAALDPMAVKAAGGTGELAVQILQQAGFPVHRGLASLPWKGTPHLTRQAPRLGSERLFVLGDAAGYIEPFTGEGMAWALAGASQVAPLALQVCRKGWDPSLLARWTAIYRRSVSRRQFVCRLTADLLRRRFTTQLMVRTLGALPWVARPFLRFMYRE
jgi:2-polyprenyl-6-methoxyphenol hydroxylase-like FAD-dependent oxidoreductase